MKILGKYYLTETIAPKGYKLSEDTIEFILEADGNIKGNRIASELGMYRQDYCGCIYSYNQRHSTD